MVLASLLIGLLVGSLLAGAAVSEHYKDEICDIKFNYGIRILNLRLEILDLYSVIFNEEDAEEWEEQ